MNIQVQVRGRILELSEVTFFADYVEVTLNDWGLETGRGLTLDEAIRDLQRRLGVGT